MLSDNAKNVIESGSALLPTKKGAAPFDIEDKAATLLLIMVKLASERRTLEQQLVKAVSIEKAVYANALFSATVKTVQEKQTQAEANRDVLDSKEEVNNLKNDITYIATCIDIYKNAHLLYRQKLRTEQEDQSF